MKKGKKDDKVEVQQAPSPPPPPPKKEVVIQVLHSGLKLSLPEQQVGELMNPNEISTKQQFKVFLEKGMNAQGQLQAGQVMLIVQFLEACLAFTQQNLFARRETTVFLNIMFEVLKHGLTTFGGEHGAKTVESDRKLFQNFIGCHVSGAQKELSEQQAGAGLTFYKEYYERNYELFQFGLNDPGKVESQLVSIFVDQPMWVPPLRDALYMGKRVLQPPGV